MKLGLYGKYIIAKADGSELDPKAKYFVLRYDKDEHAKIALKAYAESIQPHNAALADALRSELSHRAHFKATEHAGVDNLSSCIRGCFGVGSPPMTIADIRERLSALRIFATKDQIASAVSKMVSRSHMVIARKGIGRGTLTQYALWPAPLGEEVAK